jgi:4-carboxymuconolactone decarboxylase
MDKRAVIRGSLLALAFPLAVVGGWALFFPRGFYSDFPLSSRHWIESLGGYNGHLSVDFGAGLLAIAFVAVAAAVIMNSTLIRVACGAMLVWAVPHFVYHAGTTDAFGTGDNLANLLVLANTVVAPLLVLGLTRDGSTLAAPRRIAGGAVAATAEAPGRVRPAPKSKAWPLVSLTYWYARRTYGELPAPTAVFAHHPRILCGYGAMETAFEHSNKVDPRLKVLAELKAATVAGCEWCIDFGSWLSRKSGLSDEELRALPHFRDADVFSDEDKLVLEYADAMTRTPVEVPDELFDRMRARFDESQLVELTTAAAIENFRARFNWAFGIGSQGYSEGMVCALPERGPAPAATA